MKRRALLAGALPLGATSLAGCLFGAGARVGVNPNLELENATSEAVVLAVTVELNDPSGSQNRETVYDATVSLPAGSETRVLEALGDAQYEVTVSRGEETISFLTRPICDTAHTRVVWTASGTILTDVEDCE